MKKMVAIIFILGLFMVGCDGKDGVNGIAGPSGIDELSSDTCGSGKVLKGTNVNGTVMVTCVDAT